MDLQAKKELPEALLRRKCPDVFHKLVLQHGSVPPLPELAFLRTFPCRVKINAPGHAV